MGNSFLLDTHAFIWMTFTPEKLSATATATVLNEANILFISRLSYWEICLKVSLGKMDFTDDWRVRMETERSINDCTWLDISSKHCEGIIKLELHHRDPFDRMLIAQARAEGMAIITCDEKFRMYDVEVCW